MTEQYIEDNFATIKQQANVIEQRLDDNYCTKEMLVKDNKYNFI